MATGMKKAMTGTAALCALLLAPAAASAFCGFYVAGADAEMFNDATMVVMMRDGTRTVLAMQNSYEGPTENFAMVVPVPEVLQAENVRTLSPDVFDRVDQMAAPRLVEYWERDPCAPLYENEMDDGAGVVETASGIPADVVVEAEFSVAEYDIVVLSADDATSLETWLVTHEYSIPEDAEPLFRPYIEQGQYFFVARINAERLTFEDGRAVLSPLRFHYDAETFSLPIRLGLINAGEAQDLIVHTLGRNQRYNVANYDNVTIPTNINLTETGLDHFSEFYVALFDRTLERNPGAVVTEYAWNASTCDPCPGATLTEEDFLTLGADVLPPGDNRSFVLSRLHARYTAESLGEDLVFAAAPPIVGGREFRGGSLGDIGHDSSPSEVNNFQGRYIVRHRWEGEDACDHSMPGRWGGPPGTGPDSPPRTGAAQGTAFVERDTVDLASVVAQDVPSLGIVSSAAADEVTPSASSGEAGGGTTEAPTTDEPASSSRRRGCSQVSSPTRSAALLSFVGLVFFRRRRVSRVARNDT